MNARTEAACIAASMAEIIPDWMPTFTLDRQVNEARATMGKARWTALQSEQDAYDRAYDEADRRYRQHGNAVRFRAELKAAKELLK